MAILVFLAFVFIRTAGRMVFDAVNTTPQEKSGLMGYAFLPLLVAFELSFHFERLISRGGQLLPTVGRQLGFNWDFLGVNIGPWPVKACQVLFILMGVLAAGAVLKRLLGSRLQTAMQHLAWQQHGPIWLLAAGYIGLFWVG